MDVTDLEYLRSTYLYQPGRRRILSSSATQWCPVIRDLVQAGYSFLPEHYSKQGFLFRGLRPDFAIDADTASLGHPTDDCEASRVERAMGVYFVTHEISDAISASGLHENHGAAIAVIPVDFFNQQLQNHKAAVLAIGDAGFVFRYPFLATPVPMERVECIITTSGNHTLQELSCLEEKIDVLPDGNRRSMTSAVSSLLERRNIRPATPVNSTWYPH